MSRLEKVEIERLVGEIADEGSSAERIGRLNHLLRDNEELQRHYAEVMALHTLLAYDLNLSLQTFQPLIPPGEPPAAVDDCQVLSEEIVKDVRPPERWSPSRPAVWLALTSIAAAIAIAFFFWPHDDGVSKLALSPDGMRQAPDPEGEIVKVVGSLSEGRRELILTDEENLMQFSRVTKTTPLASMLLPVCSAKEFPASLSFCSGTVWMERTSGQKSRGYMLPLRSGCAIEMYVEAASSSHNALSVVEIDMYGRITGSAIHFGNMGEDGPLDSDLYKSIGGPLGTWSQRNDSPQTKYYLFTGTHSLKTRRSAQGMRQSSLQYVSDYRVLLDMPDLIYIGWDDSGYATESDGPRYDDLADYDFDDIAALIRIVDCQPQFISPSLEFEPQPDPSRGIVEPDESCYPFVVEPGMRAVLLSCTDALLSNAIEVVDAKTNQVLWRLESLQPPPGERYTAATEAYHIHNGTDQPASFFLRATHQKYNSDPQTAPWVPTPHREIVRTDENVIIGFEDSPDKGSADWNDVQVQIRWLPIDR